MASIPFSYPTRFTIAAINDSDLSQSRWEPLAPTKEAQEFRLTQKYQEGLLQMQAGAYANAQRLFETIIEDPLCAQEDIQGALNSGSMLHLRFLAFKNLAEAYVKQGFSYYNNALQCYLEAVTIDGKDAALWNHLGSLACSIGSYTIARRAFEQCLCCSPHHWISMEKLMEVLIAIGDEVSCLAVAKRLLKISAEHPRAQLVRSVIEEDLGFNTNNKDRARSYDQIALCGIDRLKPEHTTLSFSRKHNLENSEEDERLPKRKKYEIVLDLQEASWVDLIANLISSVSRIENNLNIENKEATEVLIANALVVFSLKSDPIDADSEQHNIKNEQMQDMNMSQQSEVPIIISSPEGYEINEKISIGPSSEVAATCLSYDGNPERGNTLTADTLIDDEPLLERRSTRLERLRSRRYEKNEEVVKVESVLNKKIDPCVKLRSLLEPFIVSFDHEIDNPPLSSLKETEIKHKPVCRDEESEVLQFLKQYTSNSGCFQVAHELIEKLSGSLSKPLSDWRGFLELEKRTRSYTTRRSTNCSLFIAEVYMDLVALLGTEDEISECLTDCEYNLCKLLEVVAIDMPPYMLSRLNEDTQWGKNNNEKVGDSENLSVNMDFIVNENVDWDWSFWLRYYWLCGRLSTFQGFCKQGNGNFQRCLRILEAKERCVGNASTLYILHHCKTDKEISLETAQRKLYKLEIQDFLKHSAAHMLEEGQNENLINALAPVLLRREEREKGFRFYGERSRVDFSTELDALNMLVHACENSSSKDVNLVLQCYARRLEIFCYAAGLLDSLKNPGNIKQGSLQDNTVALSSSEKGLGPDRGEWVKMASEELKLISRFADGLDEKIKREMLSDPESKLLAHLKWLLLAFLCHSLKQLTTRKGSSLNGDVRNHFEAICFVDAAVAFCRLQHLCSGVSMEKKVGLLVTVHEILAEHGLCCSGKACEGGEGVFLKMAIKRLLDMEIKLKTSFCKSSTQQCDVDGFTPLLNEDKPNEGEGEGSRSLGDDLSKENKTVIEETKDETKDGESREGQYEKTTKIDLLSLSDEQQQEIDKRKAELGLDIALDQSFFCLYGLNLRAGLDSTNEEDPIVHSNTSLGDFQTKEQCAGVFQYLLPYSKGCTRTCLLKLRKVLRSIRKLFPEPPSSILENNAIDIFMDDVNFDEDILYDMIVSGRNIREIMNYALKTYNGAPNILERKGSELLTTSCSSAMHGSSMDNIDSSTSEPYNDIYENLYFLLTQVEELSAGDKWPGFVFTEEGKEFVQQNAKLFIYDLLYNPFRFESWNKIANIYDEEVDLMLNDGSKTHNAAVWRKSTDLTARVEDGRRRTRRCLLMSLAIADTPEQKSQVHELLALVYYDTLQNVVPSYDQRQHVAKRDSSWNKVCENSLKHFEKAFASKPEWLHVFYMGKLCEKLGQPCRKALDYYQKASEMNAQAVDSIYRMHASRFKFLSSAGMDNLSIIEVVAEYCYIPSTKEEISNCIQKFYSASKVDEKSGEYESSGGKRGGKYLKEAWNLLFDDCIKALEMCLEGELKHFHKARYRLASCLFSRNEGNDLERAKEELSFCFKSNRSVFIINMWEIDGSTRRNRRKTPGAMGSKRGLEPSIPESSRKFITCLRKYLMLYLHLCEKTFDVCTLERAYACLRVDKKFSYCLADLINVTLGKYIQTLGAAISRADSGGISLQKTLLEKMFGIFMEHGSSWSETANLSLAEAGPSSESVVSEGSTYCYIHEYLHLLEAENRADVLESVNEKIRRRFKNPKLVNVHCAQICKHAALAWCRALCFALSSITPIAPEFFYPTSSIEGSIVDHSTLLVVELNSDELMSNAYDAFHHPCGGITKQSNPLLSMKGVRIRQASPDNLEKASTLLRQAFTLYRDCVGPFPGGINLFTSSSYPLNQGMPDSQNSNVVDLSVPRKLLLWAYTLVHGRVCSIAEAVRFCEDQAKTKMRKGTPTGFTQPVTPNSQERHERVTKTVVLSGEQHSGYTNVMGLEEKEKEKEKEKGAPNESEIVSQGSPSQKLPFISNIQVSSDSRQFAEDIMQTGENVGGNLEYVSPQNVRNT